MRRYTFRGVHWTHWDHVRDTSEVVDELTAVCGNDENHKKYFLALIIDYGPERDKNEKYLGHFKKLRDEKKYHIDWDDESQITPENHLYFFCAIQAGKTDIVEKFLALDGFDPNFHAGYCGQTPLDIAVSNKDRRLYASLINKGAYLHKNGEIDYLINNFLTTTVDRVLNLSRQKLGDRHYYELLEKYKGENTNYINRKKAEVEQDSTKILLLGSGKVLNAMIHQVGLRLISSPNNYGALVFGYVQSLNLVNTDSYEMRLRDMKSAVVDLMQSGDGKFTATLADGKTQNFDYAIVGNFTVEKPLHFPVALNGIKDADGVSLDHANNFGRSSTGVNDLQLKHISGNKFVFKTFEREVEAVIQDCSVEDSGLRVVYKCEGIHITAVYKKIACFSDYELDPTKGANPLAGKMVSNSLVELNSAGNGFAVVTDRDSDNENDLDKAMINGRINDRLFITGPAAGHHHDIGQAAHATAWSLLETIFVDITTKAKSSAAMPEPAGAAAVSARELASRIANQSPAVAGGRGGKS